jgi:antitoxin HicB
MASERLRSVEEYMRLPYRMEIYDDGGYWAAECPDLPGFAAGHETWEGLQAAIEDAKQAYFEAAIESGRPVPEPSAPQEDVSGRILVRLSKSLHRQAIRAARRDGVSLNTFLVAAVAKELGRSDSTQPLWREISLGRLAGSVQTIGWNEDVVGTWGEINLNQPSLEDAFTYTEVDQKEPATTGSRAIAGSKT